jgi:hypothetical protein
MYAHSSCDWVEKKMENALIKSYSTVVTKWWGCCKSAKAISYFKFSGDDIKC